MSFDQAEPVLRLQPVNEVNWRDVIQLKVNPGQEAYVAEPSFYLLLCHYGGIWHPLAVTRGEQVIGFLMWAVDPQDGSGWLGGFLLDKQWQGRGLGRQALLLAMQKLRDERQITHFALSVQPENPAVRLYRSLGFTATEEWEDEEQVMHLRP